MSRQSTYTQCFEGVTFTGKIGSKAKYSSEHIGVNPALDQKTKSPSAPCHPVYHHLQPGGTKSVPRSNAEARFGVHEGYSALTTHLATPQIHHFGDIGYRHNSFNNCPAKLRNHCDCDAMKSVDFHSPLNSFGQCHSLWKKVLLEKSAAAAAALR